MKKKQLQDEFFNSFLQKATFFLIVIYSREGFNSHCKSWSYKKRKTDKKA